MRFDDSLRTVLASDAGAGFGAEATWRQLVDLIGRGKVVDVAEPVGRLRALRGGVPDAVRAASARALAFAHPPAALVSLFAEDELAIAAPVLRTAMLGEAEWLAMLPQLSPRGRSVLRHRRDLAPAVVRGLESFGHVDFTLSHDGSRTADVLPAAPDGVAADSVSVAASSPPPPVTPAPIRLPEPLPAPSAAPVPVDLSDAAPPSIDPTDAPPRFEIADLVARIDAFQRDRPDLAAAPAAANDAAADGFSFRTDVAGVIRWVEGGDRAALIGTAIRMIDPLGFTRRDPLSSLPLTIRGPEGRDEAWLLGGEAVFDPLDGRFAGYRGVGRRDPAAADGRAASEALRQLVHELRTPTNAIAGFAELIETQLLGPVAPPYREQAGTIREETTALIGAIDDLDVAARLAGHALDLSVAPAAIEPIVGRVVSDLSDDRLHYQGDGYHIALIDDRAIERLLRRLFAAMLAVARPGERLRIRVKDKAGDIAIQIDRPTALVAHAPAAAPLAHRLDDTGAGPLLGIDFALDLARDFAAALGGSLAIGSARLTLRLPPALDREVGQAAE